MEGQDELFLYEGQIPRWCQDIKGSASASHLSKRIENIMVRINFNISFVNNDDELTIMWGVHNRSIFSRLVVHEPGSVQQFKCMNKLLNGISFFLQLNMTRSLEVFFQERDVSRFGTLCRTSEKSARHRAWRPFRLFSCFALIGSLESPPSISLKAIRKPWCNSLVRDSRVRDWLWLGKILAPLTHPT
ncbi:hypothetical protein NC651_010140 [Populus alba x Populus x berolinensis]|nr:hypothetical protein NC651_010140 [Populus alba x Populus x berolinensis]